jgi:hypothetical protein
MPWFKVDDNIWSHPKFAALSDAAQALWLRAGAYCAEKLTDGQIDDRIIATLLRGKPKTVTELVESGMWRRTSAGVEFHDWLEYQPSADSVKRDREQARERMANVRANKKRSSISPVPDPDPIDTDEAPEVALDPAARDYDAAETESIRQLLTAPFGRFPDELEALTVASMLLEASPRAVTNVVGYVRRCIDRSPVKVQGLCVEAARQAIRVRAALGAIR